MDTKNQAFSSVIFRKAMSQFPTGIVIITTMYNDAPVGLSAQSFVSLSMDPPMISFSPAHTSRTAEKIKETGNFGVSILSEHQEHISRVFGSKEENKFDKLESEWTLSPGGNPIFVNSLHWLDAELVDIVPAGDHSIFLASVVHLGPTKETRPLLFFRGGYLTTADHNAQLIIESPVEPGKIHKLKD